MKKVKGLLLVPLLSAGLLLLTPYNEHSVEAKVYWDGVELKPGQIGRLTILKQTPLYKLDASKKVFVRNLKPGQKFRIYAFKPGMLGIGGGYYVDRDSRVKYETPSKAKLAQVKEEQELLKAGLQKYSGEWFTSKDKSRPGVGAIIKFTSPNKAKVQLYGIWWSMPDGSNARQSLSNPVTVTFNKNGVGEFWFIEDRAGNKGHATLILKDNKVTLEVSYPDYLPENEFLDSYIYEGTNKLYYKVGQPEFMEVIN
ncbi:MULTISPECIES: hypothetical protein [Anoxybacillaceae]|uniref:Uncharacterized protein n=1 Tax=Parageobacillus toebii NBRC 107807 TaxID=1223503 RepID=A0AA89NMR7_9BACL|nr:MULTISPECIES: hypothetical protein [Bacillaceae]MBB3870441.1 hypothetical protein [Parageobacillus toebii NBRC 107807]